jgi:hypothetical protein
MGRSLFQRSPTECGVCECDRETSQRRPRPTRPLRTWGKIINMLFCAASPTCLGPYVQLHGLNTVYAEKNLSQHHSVQTKSHMDCPGSKPRPLGVRSRRSLNNVMWRTNLGMLCSELDSHGTTTTKHCTAANSGHVRDTRCWNTSHVQQCTDKVNSTEYSKQLAARTQMTNFSVQNPHEPIIKTVKHTKPGQLNMKSLMVYTTRHTK